MVEKLIVTFEQGSKKGLINNQSCGVSAFVRQIISLAGLVYDYSYKKSSEKNLVCIQFLVLQTQNLYLFPNVL